QAHFEQVDGVADLTAVGRYPVLIAMRVKHLVRVHIPPIVRSGQAIPGRRQPRRVWQEAQTEIDDLRSAGGFAVQDALESEQQEGEIARPELVQHWFQG